MYMSSSNAVALSGGDLGKIYHLVVIQVLDLRLLELGRRQLTDPTAALQMLGSDGGDIAHKCLDRGQALVAGARATLSVFLQPAEERQDCVDIKDRVIELVHSTAHTLRGVAQEEPEAVTVGQNRVATCVAFNRQVFLEEILDQLLEGDDGGLGGFHGSTSSRARV